MSFLNKLVSGITAAPRAIGALATGNIKNFKVIDDQKVSTSLKQSYTGTALAGAAAFGGVAIAGAAGGGTGLLSKLVKKSADASKGINTSGGLKTVASQFTEKITDTIKNPALNRMISGVVSKATGQYKPSVINSPTVDQFTETKTGLQQTVFGSPVTDTYNRSVDVSWGGGGLEDFNVSTGNNDDKKKPVPVWAWVLGGIVAFFGTLALIGKLKFR